MKLALPAAALILLAACGKSATDTGPVRYNFAVIDGANQVSTAGDAALAKRVTSQLTRDPQGTFATRVFDFIAPTIAYAQGLVLSGTPVAGAIVCGREAKLGEPQVIPLCAFTLADGKAANTVVPGTKAGAYNVLFTAQVPATEPVKDSTTVVIGAGAPAEIGVLTFGPIAVAVGGTIDLHDIIGFTRDKYNNFGYLRGDVGAIGVPNFTPTSVIREGDFPPASSCTVNAVNYSTWKWACSGEPRPAGQSGWVVTLGSEWSGKRVTVYFWVGEAEHHVTADVK